MHNMKFSYVLLFNYHNIVVLLFI